MKKKGCLLLVACPLLACCAGDLVFDVDFAAETRQVDSVGGKGAFHGVLPKRVSENFAGWSDGRATAAVREEDGRRFLRIETEARPAGGQFVIDGFTAKFPGFYKLTIRGRTPGQRPLTHGLRFSGAPYTGLSSGSFVSATWAEKSEFIHVSRTVDARVGFFFYTGAGVVDIESMRLETATEEELAQGIRRPDASVAGYIRHTRFPLGLPCGWNLGRDSFEADCMADSATPASDGVPMLKLVSARPYELFSEPFQTAFPKKRHTLSFFYRSAEPVQVQVVYAPWGVCGQASLPASADGREARLAFTPPLLPEAFAVKFSGKAGPLWLDRVRLGPGETAPAVPSCEVALAPREGEIAAETRIQFADEPARIRWCVLGAPAKSVLRFRGTDLYGRTQPLADVPLSAAARREGDVAYLPASAPTLGQFRVQAWVEVEGRRVSAVEETVVTRVPRPVAWRRDAPDSPFGAHFNAFGPVVKTMKAGGVNWARLHDAGWKYTGWAAMEPEKGKWTWFDDEIRCYRDNGVKVFAQLGTAPAWATHYGDLGCRNMGYFEKYLRPTNAVDWVNYVTTVVKRYDGVIDRWFVWNEPWGRWWQEAQDIGFYDKAKAGADFAALTRQAYEAVKKVNPAIEVCGYNSTSGSGGEKWSAAVEAGGGWDCCDAIDWHYYTPNIRATRGDTAVSVDPLRPIRARHPGLPGRRVYMSEGQGTSSGGSGIGCRMSGLYAETVPWAAEDAATYIRLADWTCRYVVSLLAEGSEKVFLYSGHSYSNLAVPPNFQVLIGGDGYAAPALVSHAQMAHAIEGKRFVRRENQGRAGVAFVFAGGGRACTVYSDLARDEVLDLAARRPLKDLFGNPVEKDTFLPGTLVYAEE